MKITREKLVAIWHLIDRLSNEKTNVKFHYLLHKNKRLIEPEIKSLEEAQKPPEEYQHFEKTRIAICKEFCEKEENGNPKLKDNSFIIPDEVKPEFEAKLTALKEQYKETLEKLADSQKQFLDLVKEEVEVAFAAIPLSVMPSAVLGTDIDLLYEFITEE